MGVAASSHSQSRMDKRDRDVTRRPAAQGSFRRPSTIMVIDLEGRIKEFKQAIEAKLIISQNPNCFLCNSESMYIGTSIPRVPDEEVLRPGQIYFLIPLSQANKPLSLPALCDLAIKASSALTR
ncbi:hypothetical protein L6164_019980 [Bauhinia variegata]|uniref:Uncharacterized protein n=1 Tax=Bauhinia variegata TaxID=167791 RepID=A0ACB9MU22_BAUVA|nr:hypothetical protein L6164_019980 [Bauhinia variegata]